MNKPLESSIERTARDRIKDLGGKFIKLYPLENGMPDRLLLRSPGKMAFVEMKRPGEVPTKLQLYRHKQLRELGFDVYVCDSIACVFWVYRRLGSAKN